MRKVDCNLTHLKECLRIEVMRSDEPFSWFKSMHKGIKYEDRRFNFWFRIWRYLYHTEKCVLSKLAKYKLRRLCLRYGCDIAPMAVIGPGLRIANFCGIVIRGGVIIGRNFYIRQYVTIEQGLITDIGCCTIGDNVTIGANTCIIGDISIGDNVTIGANLIISKDLPSDSMIYSNVIY